MAEGNRSITSPVHITPPSAEMAAFELRQHITQWKDAVPEKKKDRKYWLILYVQCIQATRGVRQNG